MPVTSGLGARGTNWTLCEKTEHWNAVEHEGIFCDCWPNEPHLPQPHQAQPKSALLLYLLKSLQSYFLLPASSFPQAPLLTLCQAVEWVAPTRCRGAETPRDPRWDPRNPPGAPQPLGALQGNKCHWQNQVYLSNFYCLSQGEGELVLIQPPESTEIRRQLVQVLILHPGSQDLGSHSSSHLSCLWMWPNLSFHTHSLPVPHLWHSWAEPEL